MKILVVSATEKEILPLKNKLKINKSTVCVMKYTVIKDFSVDFLVTGVGGVFTAYALTKALSTKKYDVVINAGIAGSFNRNLEIGEVVFVESDQFADLGVEVEDSFYTMFEKGFIKKDQAPFKDALLENNNSICYELPKVSAITVNTTHGAKKSVQLFKNKFNADIETMEGAACAYVCLLEGITFMQIRSISNYVEKREDAQWDIPLAIRNLNKKLSDIIDELGK